MKHKDAVKKIFSHASVFFIICVVFLVLTGWGLSSNSTKANDLRVTNQTNAFQVVNAEIVGDRVNLTLKNVSEKTINGYALAFNRTLMHTDYTIGSFTIAPGQIEERTLPCDPNGPSRELEIQAVVFTDHSFNGSVTAAHSILHRREGMRTQLRAVQSLLDNALESSDNQLPGTMGQLLRQVASLSEGSDDGSRNRAVRFGLRDAKADVQNLLQGLIQEHDRDKNIDLRQRLIELRSQVTERANRL